MHLAIWRLDKSKLVNSGEGRHRTDQTNVRPFRRLNRANPAVVRRMNVTNFEPSAIATETAWPQGRKAPLMGQFSQRIRLVHELRKLGTPEEITNDRAQRFRVDQLLRRHAVDVDVEKRHALFD